MLICNGGIIRVIIGISLFTFYKLSTLEFTLMFYFMHAIHIQYDIDIEVSGRNAFFAQSIILI